MVGHSSGHLVNPKYINVHLPIKSDLFNSTSFAEKNVKSDIILMSVGLNRASVFYYSNPNRFKAIMKSEKILRRVDDIYLIDGLGNILISDVRDITDQFVLPSDEKYVCDNRIIFIQYHYVIFI